MTTIHIDDYTRVMKRIIYEELVKQMPPADVAELMLKDDNYVDAVLKTLNIKITPPKKGGKIEVVFR